MFTIPAGKTVRISRLSDGFTCWHKTTVTLGFERYESTRRGNYEFRHEGWIITAKRSQITLRDSERRSSRRPTYDSTASNRCVNDVMEAVGQPAEAEQR